jgi:L-lactate dehydrogenase complex protein LldF
VPGPIGSILEPARDAARHASLPFACSLCGSCTDVCPVKIELHHQLLAWRGVLAARGLLSRRKRLALRAARFVLERPRLFAALSRIGRALGRRAPRTLLQAGASAWARGRELPELPSASFRELYARRHGQ